MKYEFASRPWFAALHAIICEKAIAAGASQVTPLTTQFYGHRDSRVRDPFGHEWLLSQKVEDVSPEEMQRRWDAMAKK